MAPLEFLTRHATPRGSNGPRSTVRGVVPTLTLKLLLVGSVSFAEPNYGVNLSVGMVPFFGGFTGPSTLSGEGPSYPSSFETGWGVRFEAFRQLTPKLRGQIGLVANHWAGKSFRGGEFPQGVDFGDYSLTGFYLGVKPRFRLKARFRPFILFNFGVARLSALSVKVDGQELPYWKETYAEYMNLGTGGEFTLRGRVRAFIDVRAEVIGNPNSNTADPVIGAATGVTAFPVTLGLDLCF